MKEYDIDNYFKNKELNKKELDKLLKKDENYIDLEIIDKSNVAKQDRDIE